MTADARPGVAPSLADLSVGDVVRVDRLVGAGGTVQRLAEMGLVPGVAVTVVRFAPLGDPMEVRVRGYLLSLRKGDARAVLVRRESGGAS